MDDPSTPVSMHPAAAIQARLDRSRLRAHAGAARAATVTSVGVAVLMIWALDGAINRLQLALWVAGLLCVLVGRMALARRYVQMRPSDEGTTPWLLGFRAVIALHGLVWGAAAWLPAQPDAALLQWLVPLLLLLAMGAVVLMLFDLRAGLPFAGLVLAPLALRLWALGEMPSRAHQVAGVMGLLLLCVLVLAGLQASRARLALATTRQAETARGQEAHQAQLLSGLIFEHAGQGIMVFDRQFQLQAWNDPSLKAVGLDPGLAVRGLPLADALQSLARQGEFGGQGDLVRQQAEADKRLAMLMSDKPGVSLHRRPDGSLFELRRNPLPGGGFVLFLIDVTDRERAQAALLAQQRKLALVLERTSQGFWSIDNALCTTDANPAMCRMLGLELSQMLGRSIFDFVDEENAETFRQGVARRAQGVAEGYEISLRRADGHLVHCFNNATPMFDDQGGKVGALGLFSDITAQKQAEQRARLASDMLAQKSQVLARTLDSLEQGVLHVDTQGRCVAWNQRLLALLDLPAALMETHPTLNDMVRYQHDHGHFDAQLVRLDTDTRDSVQRHLVDDPQVILPRYQRSTHTGRVLEVVSHFGPQGDLVRTYSDITERWRAEEALHAAKEEAERANQAKSEFLSRMSHELRTPMNAILGFGQLLAADAHDPLSATQRVRVQELMRGGRHLLALIDDVLDIARIEAGRLQLVLQPVDLGAAVDDCLRLMQPVAQGRGVHLPSLLGCELAGEPGGAPSLVQADPTRLRQVLINLLSNAIKFNRAGGRVHVEARVADGQAELAVRDEGPGMAPDQLARLFQPFERLDPEGAAEGTGIGLALSRNLVLLMGGEILVSSQPGQGSVFRLRLPLGQSAGQAPAPLLLAAPLQAAAGQRRHSVLYIEDNPVNQLLMEGMLAHRPGLDLRAAELPELGLALAAEQAPDLVLLDIHLPGMDGFEVLRRLRQMPALARVPVVAVSANAMPADRDQAAQAGFDGYLCKPVDLPELLGLVDLMLAAGRPGAAAA